MGLTNLIPRARSLYYHNGNPVYNDGKQLLYIFRIRRYYKRWLQAVDHCNLKEYAAAIAVLDTIPDHMKQADVYRLAISARLLARDIPGAHAVNEKFEGLFEMNAADLVSAGLIKCYAGDYDAGLKDFHRALELGGDRGIIFNNRGFCLNTLGRYHEAIEDFNRALEINPLFAYPYNNRGLARIKIGMVREGLADIHHSLTLDRGNAYAYRNLGIYHLDRSEFPEALELLRKARGLDLHTHMVEEYIAMAEQGLAAQAP